MTINHAYIGFGSNLGDRLGTMHVAVDKLRDEGVSVLRISRLLDTEPWGGAEGGRYLNAVFEIEKAGDPTELLNTLFRIEASLGRVRKLGGDARTCDLDILLWGDETRYTDRLIIPHPLIDQRRFVLVSLCELIPDAVHPKYGVTFTELLNRCRDTSEVKVLEEQSVT